MMYMKHVTQMGKNRESCKVSVIKLKEIHHFETLSVDGAKILKLDFRNGSKGVDRIHLTRNRDQCLVLVNTAMNFRSA
jgi:hypothetical protein